MSFDWTPKQQGGLDAVHRWMQAGGSGVYRLFGFAGTGKTTLAKYFAEGLSGQTIYAAYTGKAAHVLQQKGCMGATTIHKLIYKPADKSKENLLKLRDELEALEAQLRAAGQTEQQIDADLKIRKLRHLLSEEQKSHKRPSFTLNEDSIIRNAALVVIDECSMVDEYIGHDLESFGVPILVLGDPFQLPPVRGFGYFTEAQPDTLLTEIRRQEADSPVLQLCTAVREGRGLQYGTYGDSRVISRADVDREEVMNFDQVLVGTNKLRFNTNARLRELRGFPLGQPSPGDRVVCLRNNHEVGLLNGGQWTVRESVSVDDQSWDITIDAENSTNTLAVTTHAHYFRGEEPPFWDIKTRECFDFGYALTVHKSQGSQWDKVYIFDESRCFRQEAARWLYTAITRAAKQVVVVKD